MSGRANDQEVIRYKALRRQLTSLPVARADEVAARSVHQASDPDYPASGGQALDRRAVIIIDPVVCGNFAGACTVPE